MNKKEEIMSTLKAHNIEFDPKSHWKTLEKMLPKESSTAQETQNNQLSDILETMAKSLEDLSTRISSLENRNSFTTQSEDHGLDNVFSITKGTTDNPETFMLERATVQEESKSFLSQIPRDMEEAARKVLADPLFKFECEALSDQPSFAFTVVVPKHLTDVVDQEDRRTRIIQNVVGVNGVVDWCELVKQNILKHLKKQITYAS